MRHFLTAKRKGHGIHSPFAFKLCEEVFYNRNIFYDFEGLKRVRDTLLSERREVIAEDLGAGSKKLNISRTISEIVSHGTSSTKQSELLYKLINFLRPVNIIELGTSVGLNTLYLCLANKNSKVYSIEGSKVLNEYAMELGKKNKISNCEYISGNFDSKLPELLLRVEKPSFVYIDGNHTFEATIRYFELLLSKLHPDMILVFDDIYWSKGMTEAWNVIKSHEKVKMSIDSFHFGMIFFKEEIKQRVEIKILI